MHRAARQRLLFAFPVSSRQRGKISFTALRRHQGSTWWANKNDINASLHFSSPLQLCVFPRFSHLPSSIKYELRWHARTFFFPFPFFSLTFVAFHLEVCYETGYCWFPRATAFECTVFPRLSASRPSKFFRAAAFPVIEAGGSFKVQLGKWHGCINSFSPSDFSITFLLDLYACLSPSDAVLHYQTVWVFLFLFFLSCTGRCCPCYLHSAPISLYPLVHTAVLSTDWYFLWICCLG